MGNSMGWGGWLMMGVGLVLCVAVLTVLVVWLSRNVGPNLGPRQVDLSTSAPPIAATGTARTTLDERFASGDIDEADYLRRKSVLRDG